MMEMLAIWKWMVGVLLGFFLPGFFVTRRFSLPMPLVASLGISVILLFYVIFLLGLCGVRLGFFTVGFPLGFATCILALACKGSGKSSPFLSRVSLTGDQWVVLLFGIIGSVLLAAHFWCRPFVEYDGFFRWNFLAVKLFQHGHFEFYPPVNGEDFAQYFYPDGMAPLIAFGRWWLYAAFGSLTPQMTAVFSLLQVVAIGIVTYAVAKEFSEGTGERNQETGFWALGILLTSPLFYFTLAMGAESKFIVLSVLACLYYLHDARRRADAKSIMVAGLFTALGALTREYAWIFLWGGICTCLIFRFSPKRTLIYICSSFVWGAPWFIRNFLRTGNPFYDNPTWGWFPGNQIHLEILASYRAVLGLGQPFIPSVLWCLEKLALMAPIQIVLGSIAAVWLCRRFPQIMVYLILTIVVWCLFVNYTVGGLMSSFRALAPALALLSVLVAVMLDRSIQTARLRRGVYWVITGLTVRAMMLNVILPYYPLTWKEWTDAARSIPELYRRSVPPYAGIPESLQRHAPQISRILTEEANFHAAFFDSDIEVVPIWSPEFRFVFDRTISPLAVRRRLIESGVQGVWFFPGGIDAGYLNRFPFYQVDHANWKPIMSVGSSTLYELPRDEGEGR